MNQAGTSLDIRENLSAGIDGELSKEQLRFLLRRLDHDAALQQTWTRYHLARDGLRHQLPPLAAPGFAARVLQAIEQEAVTVVGSRRGHWLRWSAGGAIAASVAAAALILGQPTGDAERSAVFSAPQASSMASTAPALKPAAPAAVPPWLSGDSVGLLSQQASVTFGAPLGQGQPAYAQRLAGYPQLHRYRTLNNNDGSYLLLLDRQPRASSDLPRRAAVAQ